MRIEQKKLARNQNEFERALTLLLSFLATRTNNDAIKTITSIAIEK